MVEGDFAEEAMVELMEDPWWMTWKRGQGGHEKMIKAYKGWSTHQTDIRKTVSCFKGQKWKRKVRPMNFWQE